LSEELILAAIQPATSNQQLATGNQLRSGAQARIRRLLSFARLLR
jgi:hypothetical protein